MASRLLHVLDVATSYLATILRGGLGLAASGAAQRQPQQPIALYEFEACPYGRLVREALTALDLDALIHPCPEGGQRFRPAAQAKGGKLQFPFLVDPNTGRSLYESADIIAYLSETYGGSVRSG
ncbi:MAG: glutathione S-transferase N-terminal domain-containing protein, partial [Burkholderiales bacterium]